MAGEPRVDDRPRVVHLQDVPVDPTRTELVRSRLPLAPSVLSSVVETSVSRPIRRLRFVRHDALRIDTTRSVGDRCSCIPRDSSVNTHVDSGVRVTLSSRTELSSCVQHGSRGALGSIRAASANRDTCEAAASFAVRFGQQRRRRADERARTYHEYPCVNAVPPKVAAPRSTTYLIVAERRREFDALSRYSVLCGNSYRAGVLSHSRRSLRGTGGRRSRPRSEE